MRLWIWCLLSWLGAWVREGGNEVWQDWQRCRSLLWPLPSRQIESRRAYILKQDGRGRMSPWIWEAVVEYISHLGSSFWEMMMKWVMVMMLMLIEDRRIRESEASQVETTDDGFERVVANSVQAFVTACRVSRLLQAFVTPCRLRSRRRLNNCCLLLPRGFIESKHHWNWLRCPGVQIVSICDWN